jgi:methionine-S-sulfoxide reductase
VAGQTEVAVLAGGCFWGVEDILRDVPGVIDTDVGYTGGHLENPTYDDTHDSKSGHAEAIRVTFDPAVLNYEELLEKWFFRLHDPTTLNRQGNDVGTQYRSAIFPQNAEQREIAERVKARVEAIGQVEATGHDEYRGSLHLVQRGTVPPGLPAQASGRIQLPFHAGLRKRETGDGRRRRGDGERGTGNGAGVQGNTSSRAQRGI